MNFQPILLKKTATRMKVTPAIAVCCFTAEMQAGEMPLDQNRAITRERYKDLEVYTNFLKKFYVYNNRELFSVTEILETYGII